MRNFGIFGRFWEYGSDCRGGTPIKTIKISQSLSKKIPPVPPIQRQQSAAGITQKEPQQASKTKKAAAFLQQPESFADSTFYNDFINQITIFFQFENNLAALDILQTVYAIAVEIFQ